MTTLTPFAFRDYKSKKAMMADWDANKFFNIATIGPDTGRSCTKSDAHRAGWTKVKIRYDRLTKVAIVKVSAVGPGEER